MNKSILIIVPSRSSGGIRQANCDRFMEAWRNTTSGLSDVLFVLDDDDEHYYFRHHDANYVVGPNEKLVPKLNRAALAHEEDYPVIGFLGDDIVLETKGWEEMVLAALPKNGNGLGMVYGNDTIQGAALPTHIFMTSVMIRILGFMVPTHFVHLYCDNFWQHLGNSLKCLKYLPGFITAHYHYANGKAVEDQQYKDTYARMAQDASIYHQWLNEEAHYDIQKLKQYIFS